MTEENFKVTASHSETKDIPWWLDVLQRQGLATVLLLGVCYAGWCTLAWLAPKLDTVIMSHVQFLRATEATQRDVLANQSRIVAVTESQSETLDKLLNNTASLTNQKLVVDIQNRLITISESQSRILETMATKVAVIDSKVDEIHRVIIRSDRPITIKSVEPAPK